MDKVIRWFLAVVFLIAIVGKLRSTAGDTIWDASPRLVRAVVLVGEIGIAAWLMIGWRPKYSALACVVVLFLFSGVIALELSKAHPKPCGCGLAVSSDDTDAVRRSLAANLVRNLLLITAAGFVFVSARRRVSRVSEIPCGGTAPNVHAASRSGAAHDT